MPGNPAAPTRASRALASLLSLSLVLFFPNSGCQRKSPPPPLAAPKFQCDPDNGGLMLPPGFCAGVVADHVANLRGLAVDANGDIYGALLNRRLNTGGLVVMRDTDGDGRADTFDPFGNQGGIGLAIYHGYLYFGTDRSIQRFRLGSVSAPPGNPEVVVEGLPAGEMHASKTLTFDDARGLYVSVGAPSNVCQSVERSPGSPGLDPCPQLDHSAGVWRFDAETLGQPFAKGERYASGIRHALAIEWNPGDSELYVVQHGRDQLSELWPQYYTAEQGSQLPAEEMLKVTRGAAFSWPYCYFDPQQRRRVLAPEYGGDGMRVERCADFPSPTAVFPAHFGPNDLLFYQGSQFPRRYRGGAFIAFHGSYSTLGGGVAGYQVAFVPADKGVPGSNWEVFANGFAGALTGSGSMPEYRPTALAEGPDGSLYVADSVNGRVWRITYRSTRPPPAAVPPIPARDSGAAIPQNPGNTNESR